MNKLIFTILLLLVTKIYCVAQQSNTNSSEVIQNLPISKADLGIFPYFKTFPNCKPQNTSDSITLEQNVVYFYDGKNYFTVEGKVSAQTITVIDNKKKALSEFQITRDFDKVVATLGGKKIYAGKLPQDALQKASKADMTTLSSQKQLVFSAHYGVVEYVIKTSEKEVWIQLVPSSITSDYYCLLVVEKQNQLIATNINKQNNILNDLEKKGKAFSNLEFELDSPNLLSQSKDEVLNIAGVFQAHPDWKIKIEIHNAPLDNKDYVLSLTQKRAEALKNELTSLGVKTTLVEINGWGDTKPLVGNNTEKGRQTNTRVEILKL